MWFQRVIDNKYRILPNRWPPKLMTLLFMKNNRVRLLFLRSRRNKKLKVILNYSKPHEKKTCLARILFWLALSFCKANSSSAHSASIPVVDKCSAWVPILRAAKCINTKQQNIESLLSLLRVEFMLNFFRIEKLLKIGELSN